MSRLALLLEQRRDGRLDAGQRAELERLLDDPTQASLAVAVERSALQISAGLRSRPGLGPAVRAGSQRRSRGLRALRGVRRSLERRSWAWAWAAAAVLAIAVLVVLVGRTPSAADSAMRLEQGTVTVQRGGERLPIPVGADWGGDELQVASPSRFVAGDGTVVALESGSRVRLTPSDGLLLELDHGAAELVVQPQPPGRQVAVRTRDAEISVIGTRFRVTTRDDGTGVSVAEGRVRIRSGGADRFLAAGQTWDSRPGSPGMQAELRGFIADGDGWIADGRPRVSFADGTSLEAVERIDADGSLRLVGGGWDVSVGWMSGGGRASGRIILHATAEARPIDLHLIELAGPPGDGRDWPTAEGWTRDGLPWLWLSSQHGELGVVAEAEGDDLALACAPSGGRQRIRLRCQPPQTGETAVVIHVSAGPSGREPAVIAERLAAFADRHPPAQAWHGLRRLAMFGHVGGAEPTPGNPNRWFADAFDARTEQGRQRFRELLLADADAAIADLRPLAVDGVVAWGLEGSRWINDVGLIADPRRLRELAPEMDEAADALFARFSAAGLRTGVLVRPWPLDLAAGSARFLFDGSLAEQELASRVEYAKRRWGCTIFVVMFAANGWHGSAGMPPAALRRIAARHPDCTFITDLGSLAWRGPAGGWQTLSSLRSAQEPAWWKRVYPAGRDVLQIDMPADAEGLATALHAGLTDGGVPMWWWHRGFDGAGWARLLDATEGGLRPGKDAPAKDLRNGR